MSAKGAAYGSQGRVQAQRSTKPLDRNSRIFRALKVRHTTVNANLPVALSELETVAQSDPGAASRFHRDLPLATLFRAFGASRHKQHLAVALLN